MSDYDDWRIVAWCIAGVMLAVGLVVYYEGHLWPKYRERHNCVASGRSRTELIPIYHDSLKMVLQPINQSEWRCDDGTVWH